MKIHADNPLRFDFILDRGDSLLSAIQLKEESAKLLKYFLASLTVPDKQLWVNLSPYEKDRIIPSQFGLTEMGRDLLAEDYLLKQITASLIYPEDETGRRFWKRIYEKAATKYGTTDVPINTFNKVWIVPEKAVVYENAQAGSVYVVESRLKVMLEQDYLALQKRRNDVSGINALGSQIVREIILPELANEVNEDKNFARLRQVYNSLILATWYKMKIKGGILAQVYADKNKVAGVEYTSSIVPAGRTGGHFKDDIEGLYQTYIKAFKQGVYNYIKEEQDPVSGQIVPRKYFSGGVDFDMNETSLGNARLLIERSDSAMKVSKKIKFASGSLFLLSTGVVAVDSTIGFDSLKIAYEERAAFHSSYNIRSLRRFFQDIEGKLKAAFIPLKEDSSGVRHFNNAPDIFQEVAGVIEPMLREQMARVEATGGSGGGYNSQMREMVKLLTIGKALGSIEADIGHLRIIAETLQIVPYKQKQKLINALAGLPAVYMKGSYDKNKPTIIVVSGFRSGGIGVQQSYISQIENSYNVAFFYYDSWNKLERAAEILGQALKSYPFGRKVVLAGHSTGNDVIRLALLRNPDLDFSKSLFIEMVSPYAGASMAELNRYFPFNINEYKFITATHDPYGKIAPVIFSKENLQKVASRIKQVSFSVKGDKYAPKFYSSKSFINNWKQAFEFGEHLVVAPKIGLDHFHLPEQKPIVTSVLLLLMEFEEGKRPVGAIIKNPSAVTGLGSFLEKEYGLNIQAQNWNEILFNGGLNAQKLRSFFGFEGNDWLKAKPVISTVRASDKAQMSKTSKPVGGIDLNPSTIPLEVRHNIGGIKFNLDPAVLKRLQKVPGFAPVIINIQPMKDISSFLGLNKARA